MTERDLGCPQKGHSIRKRTGFLEGIDRDPCVFAFIDRIASIESHRIYFFLFLYDAIRLLDSKPQGVGLLFEISSWMGEVSTEAIELSTNPCGRVSVEVGSLCPNIWVVCDEAVCNSSCSRQKPDSEA